MSNMKHTPGPWEVSDIQEGEVKPENDSTENKGWKYMSGYIKSGVTILAEVKAMQINVFLHDFDQFEANAKLIAAAPDMLEALQKIAELRHPDRSCSLEAQGYSEQECEVIANNDYAAGIAIEAIKKATE